MDAMHLNGNGIDRKKSVNNGIERLVSVMSSGDDSIANSRKTSVNSVTSEQPPERKKSVNKNNVEATSKKPRPSLQDDELHQRNEQAEQREAFVKLLSKFIR